MNGSSSSISITRPLKRFFRRYHLILFFLVVSAGFAGGILYINQILTETAVDDTYVSPISAGSIDEATLQRLGSLHTSDQIPVPAFPEGRLNPFGE